MKRNTPGGPNDEYGTPLWLYRELDLEFSFTLDVCASELNHKCRDYLTKEQDALKTDWGHRNFCNPPYSDQLPWVYRSLYFRDGSEVRSTVSVMLMKFDPSVTHGRVCLAQADEVRPFVHRFPFDGQVDVANFPCSLAIFRGDQKFRRKSGAQIIPVDYSYAMPEGTKGKLKEAA